MSIKEAKRILLYEGVMFFVIMAMGGGIGWLLASLLPVPVIVGVLLATAIGTVINILLTLWMVIIPRSDAEIKRLEAAMNVYRSYLENKHR